LINPLVLLVIILVQGWTESGVLKNSLLRRMLESIPGVVVIVPEYLEGTARGKFAKFKTHQEIERYAFKVELSIGEARNKYPDAQFLYVGHSLGGVILRYLHAEGRLPSKDMILVGTPNKGITHRTVGGSFGVIVLPILKVLASKPLCNVPVLYQLLEGSEFLQELNRYGIPRDATYISGTQDKTVPLWSSDPYNIGESVPCGHHLVPNEEELVKSSAIPKVVRIVEERLAEIKAAAS
jgi:Zn ribbon nucleic-acid-binding protein